MAKTAIKRLFPPLLLAASLLLSSCSSVGGSPYDFISFKAINGAITIRLNMDHDTLYQALAIPFGTMMLDLQGGIHTKWADDKTTCVSIQDFGSYFETYNGLSVNSDRADVLPAYAADTAIRIIQNDDSKIILGKQIDGVNYTVTYRFYPDGAIKYISITNADQYTEDEADFP